jgi:UPF0716 protein FxsA
MPFLLLFAFVVVPLVELAVIQQVADAITLGPTLVLLLLDSVLGAWLVRREGSRAWQALRAALTDGRMPGDEIVQGALVLFGGALLLTPGFVTDVVGLALVLPPTRRTVARVLRLRFVPVPLQTGGAVWNSVRQRRDDDGPGGGRTGGSGSPPLVEDVEVLSIEREPDPDADPDRA